MLIRRNEHQENEQNEKSINAIQLFLLMLEESVNVFRSETATMLRLDHGVEQITQSFSLQICNTAIFLQYKVIMPTGLISTLCLGWVARLYSKHSLSVTLGLVYLQI